MKDKLLIVLGLIFTLLTGSTLVLFKQNSNSKTLEDTANCLEVRDNFPFPTESNPNPERSLFAHNRCYKLGYKFSISYEDLETQKFVSFDTPCLKNNEQFKLPFNVPAQIQNSWQTFCK